MAEEKANKLKVPLLSLDGKGDSYGKELQSLGGPVPFEYSDGAGGLIAKGKSAVIAARFVRPQSKNT